MKRNDARRQSVRMAYSGMLTALSVVLMLSGTLIPVMTYAAPLMCGILLLPAMLEFGKPTAWCMWGATALVTLLLGVDREAAMFYLFIGWYPLIKWQLDKIMPKPLRVVAKSSVFTITIGLMYALLDVILHISLLQEMGGVAWTIAFFVIMVVLMLIYDRLLWPMCLVYSNRIKPKLRFPGLK